MEKSLWKEKNKGAEGVLCPRQSWARTVCRALRIMATCWKLTVLCVCVRADGPKRPTQLKMSSGKQENMTVMTHIEEKEVKRELVHVKGI